MEELKQLIREDKELLHQVDKDLMAFRGAVKKLDEALALFRPFFERQDRFMVLMQELMEKRLK